MMNTDLLLMAYAMLVGFAFGFYASRTKGRDIPKPPSQRAYWIGGDGNFYVLDDDNGPTRHK